MSLDVYSSDPCPRCNGSGRKISSSALKALIPATGKTQAQIAESMQITPQFLCDLLNERRDFTSKLLQDFMRAIGPINQDND